MFSNTIDPRTCFGNSIEEKGKTPGGIEARPSCVGVSRPNRRDIGIWCLRIYSTDGRISTSKWQDIAVSGGLVALDIRLAGFSIFLLISRCRTSEFV